MPHVRVHDLKHAYERRLGTADAPEEDRKELLGRKSGKSMTTHYSAAEIRKPIPHSNRAYRDARRETHTIAFFKKKDRRVSGG